MLINKKKRTYPLDLAVLVDESKKIDKYLDLARELKKLWNMKVTVIPIVVGLKRVGLEKRLGELEIRKIETIQTTSIAKIALNSQKRPEKTFCHTDSSERLPANIHVKSFQRVKNKIFIYSFIFT